MFVIRMVYNITKEVITMADFSTKLKDIIESRGVTQAWLAEKTGATEATISRYLSGVHKPNLEIVARIAQALNVSIDYIMDLSLSPTPYKEPEREIVILADAYRRADDDHKNIVWSVLDSYLTPEEKTFVSQPKQDVSAG
jgi:transcriptional regulator with XRE-family HTH domain